MRSAQLVRTICAVPALDALDQRLLAALRVNARESTAGLARSLGVTRATVTARMQHLQASGVVLGFTVRVREDADPRGIRAITLVELEGRTTDAVVQELRGLPQVEALHSTSGAWDLVAQLRLVDLQELDWVLRRLRSVRGVLNSETSLLLTSVLR